MNDVASFSSSISILILKKTTIAKHNSTLKLVYVYVPTLNSKMYKNIDYILSYRL